MYEGITVVGYQAKEPSSRFNPDGKQVTYLRIATSRNYVDSRGEFHKTTTWYNITVGGKQAEFMAEHSKKGSLIMAAGKLMSDPETGNPKIYTRTDGTPASSYDILADTVRLLDRKEAGTDETDYSEIPF